jgi:hypothetical protein
MAIARPQDAPVDLGGMVPFHALGLADGRAVILLPGINPLSTETHQHLDSLSARCARQYTAARCRHRA